MKHSKKYNWLKFCKDSLDQIENYQQALAENFKGWCIHHRLEIQQDKIVSRQQLIDQDLYYRRPASELVFMTNGEHMKLHMTGKHLSEETRKKLSESQRGKHRKEETRKKISESHKGKQFSEEHRKKLSESLSGENHPFFGKHRSEDTRQKLSQSLKGKTWWNNGVSNKKARECPGEGWQKGILKHRS